MVFVFLLSCVFLPFFPSHLLLLTSNQRERIGRRKCRRLPTPLQILMVCARTRGSKGIIKTRAPNLFFLEGCHSRRQRKGRRPTLANPPPPFLFFIASNRERENIEFFAPPSPSSRAANEEEGLGEDMFPPLLFSRCENRGTEA